MTSPTHVRYVMIGGFLGAGKTTAMLKLADRLRERNLRAGLITNDQSIGLVDTGRALNSGHRVEEVTGGCFCCKFHTLLDAAENLTCEGNLDILLAEPVGSCTDIRATVGYPLRQLFGDRYTVAPLSVMVDPHRCAEALCLTPNAPFAEGIAYIYRKQLEEADLILINKIDALEPELRARLSEVLHQECRQARILEVSCQTGEGLDEWFDILLHEEMPSRSTMEVDYDLYAEGEALLGWLNARASFTTAEPIAGVEFLETLISRLQTSLASYGIEIAHCKANIESGNPANFSSLSLISTATKPQTTTASATRLHEGQLVLNLRAEADPDQLRNLVMTTLFTMSGVTLHVDELAAFRPGRPVPTHRVLA